MPEGGPQLPFPKDTAAQATPEPLIFTMPERYRGGHTPMVESKPPSPSTPSKPSTPPPPPKPPPLPTGKPPPPKKKSNTKVLLVAGVLVLIALGLSGFFLLQTLQAPEPEPEIPAVLPPPPTGEGEVTEETGGEEETVETTEPFPVTARPGTDSDSDGLTDVEEQSIYGTDPFLPDTDADGFLDGNEVFHRYNPNGTAPGTLEAAGLVKPYNASVAVGADPLPYGILYPAVWSLTGDDPVNIIFESSTSEQIRVTVSAKAAGEALASWLTSQGTDPTSFRGSTTKNGLSLLLSEDQLTAYVDGGEKVLTLRYDLGIKGSIDYLQTFQMMLNSLSF